MNKYIGETFLSKLYRDMHSSNEVVSSSKPNDSKYEKIKKYLTRLDNIHLSLKEKDKLKLIKYFYYKKYIIKKENITDEYFKRLEDNALNRGFGHIKYNDLVKDNEKENIINDQRKSLDIWIDYFVSEDSNIYPTWFKYYVFQSIVKMGNYDKEKKIYNQRTEKTLSIFPELNREALSIIYDYFNKYLNGTRNLEDEHLEKLISSYSFKKIYAYVLNKVSNKKEITNETDGVWKKYNQYGNYQELVSDIKGKGTGWCTAGEKTAEVQLNGGDFYIYFTYDKDNKPTIPRIAIRMELDEIGEIRGIEPGQNIEECMEKIVEEKLLEFPTKDIYLKKTKDMKLLTQIYNKHKNNEEITKEELIFLYELKENITSFGYETDPRITEIKSMRNKKYDLTKIFNCTLKEIEDEEENINKSTKIFIGNISNSSILPQDCIIGNLTITKEKNITYPQIISGSLEIRNIFSLNDTIFPNIIKEYLDLNSIETISSITFPTFIGEDLILKNLKTYKDFKLPEYIGGNLLLNNLKSVDNIKFPKYIGGIINLSSLENIEGLELPDNFDFSKLIIKEELKEKLKNNKKVYKK